MGTSASNGTHRSLFSVMKTGYRMIIEIYMGDFALSNGVILLQYKSMILAGDFNDSTFQIHGWMIGTSMTKSLKLLNKQDTSTDVPKIPAIGIFL